MDKERGKSVSSRNQCKGKARICFVLSRLSPYACCSHVVSQLADDNWGSTQRKAKAGPCSSSSSSLDVASDITILLHYMSDTWITTTQRPMIVSVNQKNLLRARGTWRGSRESWSSLSSWTKHFLGFGSCVHFAIFFDSISFPLAVNSNS